jgi:hypothetical protein
LKKKFFDLSFLCFVNEFLVVSNNSFSDGLSDGVDLGDVTTSSNGDSDVEVLESFETEEKDWLHNFDPK